MSQICDICGELKSKKARFFRNPNCFHMFCSDCISKHVASKIQENITVVRCPGVSCKSSLEPANCRSILPSVVFYRWVDSLSKSEIRGWRKFYCPYKDCSALLMDESVGSWKIGRKSMCPKCNRLYCGKCKVPWHSDFECEEFQECNEDKKNRDDLLFMKLAKLKKWQACKRCKYFVERTEGCLHITCRCGFEFCYSCGAGWTSTHNCHRD